MKLFIKVATGVWVIFLCVTSRAAYAQQPQYSNNAQNTGQYSEWHANQNNDAGLIQELNKLINTAERDRAADWQFLRDLRQAISRYDRPWQRRILLDDFHDGNVTANPAWQVISGNFSIDRYGLRTYVTPSSSQQNSQNSQDNGDVGSLVFGALLEELAKNKSADQGQDSNSQVDAMLVPLKISNAFQCQINATALRDNGQMEWTVYVGRDHRRGYRLIWYTGSTAVFELVTIDPHGSRVLQRVQTPDTTRRGRSAQIEWNRNQYGEMQVMVDGQRIISVRDNGFSSNFNGFMLANRGGEFSVRQVQIDGI